MPRHRWPPYLATGLLCIAIAILIAAFNAYATDVNVTQTAACVNPDTGRYNVTVTAHNTYDQTLHITVNNPASPIGLSLAPGQTWTFTFHVTTTAWTVKFTSPDAVLHGDTNRTWTLEDVCGIPATTTTSPPPTTCREANPPRTDCGPVPPATVLPTTVVPPSTSVVAPPDMPPPPGGPVSSPPATAAPRLPTSVARPPTQLPVTGASDVIAISLAGLAVLIAGSVLWACSKRRSS